MIMKLNVGDKVIVHGRWNENHIGTVEKITPTGLIKVEGRTYYEDGTQRGGDTWSRSMITEVTPEAFQKFKDNETIRKAIRICNSITINDIDIDTANKLIEMLGDNGN